MPALPCFAGALTEAVPSVGLVLQAGVQVYESAIEDSCAEMEAKQAEFDALVEHEAGQRRQLAAAEAEIAGLQQRLQQSLQQQDSGHRQASRGRRAVAEPPPAADWPEREPARRPSSTAVPAEASVLQEADSVVLRHASLLASGLGSARAEEPAAEGGRRAGGGSVGSFARLAGSMTPPGSGSRALQVSLAGAGQHPAGVPGVDPAVSMLAAQLEAMQGQLTALAAERDRGGDRGDGRETQRREDAEAERQRRWEQEEAAGEEANRQRRLEEEEGANRQRRRRLEEGEDEERRLVQEEEAAADRRRRREAASRQRPPTGRPSSSTAAWMPDSPPHGRGSELGGPSGWPPPPAAATASSFTNMGNTLRSPPPSLPPPSSAFLPPPSPTAPAPVPSLLRPPARPLPRPSSSAVRWSGQLNRLRGDVWWGVQQQAVRPRPAALGGG